MPTRLILVGFLLALVSAAAIAAETPDLNDELRPVAVPEPSPEALRYYRSGLRLWAVDEVWAVVVPAVLLVSGGSARLRNLARRFGKPWFFTVGAYAFLYTWLMFLVSLPLLYDQGFLRPHAYGLSNQTFGRWLGNSLKMTLVSAVVGFLVSWVPYLLLKRSPRRWWLVTSLLVVPFLFLAMFITPLWIDPLFNKYGPLKDRALEAKIVAEARRAGIEGGRIFEVDKSVDTKALNAYVKGVLGTKRIVLWDTLTRRMSAQEVLVVMGHEMGHYVLGHVARTIVLSSTLVVISLYWVDRAGRRLIAQWHGRFGFEDLADVASVPLILLLLQVSSFALEPIANAYSRAQEHEADRFALELTRTNHSAGRAFVTLQQENLSNPRPGWISRTWRGTHPAIADRIEFCNDYHPWTEGKPLRYGHLFRP